MLFKPYHIEQIRSGEKIVTRREWAEEYPGPNVGSVVMAVTELMTSKDEAECFIRITDRYEQPLGEMTDEDAQKEGDYETVNEFKSSYREIYGGWDPNRVVDVVEFEYVGRNAKQVVNNGD